MKCAICGRELRELRGLSGHVKRLHNMSWEDYRQKFMQGGADAEKEEQKPAEKQAEEKPADKPKQPLASLPDEAIDMIARRVAELIGKGGGGQPLTALPPGVTPLGEEVEVRGEKVNYKVALNPEVFYLYNIFRTEAERRGRKWDGDFSDFIYMAAKDVLAIHGIHPAVLNVRGGSLVVKLPISALAEEGEEE